VLDAEDKNRLNERLEEAKENPPNRYEGFFEHLYRAGSFSETERNIIHVQFLGFRIRVHQDIAKPLENVEQELIPLIQTDKLLQDFFDNLKTIAGFNWRSISGTESRSFHSFGIALDFIPKDYRGKQPYWQWYLPYSDEWYAIPYEKRWMIPAQIVQAFEEHGFIWGGKWFLFDTMHFEYRPELLILTRQREETLSP
jgi:hypothetical protein